MIVPSAGKIGLLCVLSTWGCSEALQPENAADAGAPSTSGASGQAGSSRGGGGAGGAPAAGGETASSSGTAGLAGAGQGNAGGGSAGATNTGISCDPGTEGNGVHDQPGPYGRAAETNVNPATPQGTLSAAASFHSAIYERDFVYRVYAPAQYKRGQRAALMIVQDGPSHYLGKTEAKFFTNVIMDNLIAEGTVPVTIGLFIDVCESACEDQRRAIYDDPSDKFARFLLEEIVPQVITKDYSVVTDPEGWLGVGFSAGATTSFAAAMHHPELMKRVIGHNSSFPAHKANGTDWAKVVAQEPNHGLRVSLVSGTMDLSDERGNWLASSKEMATALSTAGYPVRLMTGTGGHYPPDQSAVDFPNALRWIWQGCRLSDY